MSRLRQSQVFLCFAVLVGILFLPTDPAEAGGRKGKSITPSHLDPDRWMSFGRLSRAPYERPLFRDLTISTAVTPLFDSSLDPYSLAIKGSRYEPQTGRVVDGLADKVRRMRQVEDQRRSSRSEADLITASRLRRRHLEDVANEGSSRSQLLRASRTRTTRRQGPES